MIIVGYSTRSDEADIHFAIVCTLRNHHYVLVGVVGIHRSYLSFIEIDAVIMNLIIVVEIDIVI